MRQFQYALLLFFCGSHPLFSQDIRSSLSGKIICIDPGHGGTALTDHYRVGPSGEREEWINLRVGLLLKKMLEDKGARVVLTRSEDNMVTLPERAKLAVDNHADIFVSIHHNATADSTVNFPIIYFHGNASENLAGVAFGKLLAENLVKKLYRNRVTEKENFVSVVSDFTVFAESGASVLRNTYGKMPAVLAEASFFTNAGEEQKLKENEHNQDEAAAYLAALELFFKKPVLVMEPKNSKVPVIPAFKVFQEAERMTPIAKNWYHDFTEAEKLIAKKDSVSNVNAYALYTRSARSFPDSYVAAICHLRRSALLKLLGKPDESAQEGQRAKEYYVKMLTIKK